jgi:hypothetical protein
MASFANIQYRGYNGGWHNWSGNNANLYGAYAGTDSSKHCVVIALQTSSTYSGTSSSVTLTIPFVRQSKSAKSGTFYVKWHGTTDPTGGNKPQPCGSATVTKAWESNDQNVHTVSVTFNTADITAASTWYYISIGSSKTIQVGYKGYDSYWGSSFAYWTAGTAPTCSISQTAGDNTITFSGKLGKSGTSNAMSSATLYYWMNGASSYSSQALTATSEGSWSVTKTANQDDRVWAYVKCAYPHGDKSCSEVWKDCYYYTAGGAPTCTISQTAGSNTVTISGNKGTNGSHNDKTACKLYYNRGTGEANQVVDLNISGSTYSYTLPAMTSTNNNKTIGAYVTTTYTYGDAKTGYASSITSKYYSPVTAGTVTITDHGDNTFTITATKGGNGSNNTASGPSNLKWGYDTNYSNTYTSGTAITLTTSGTGETRKVYAKADTTGQYFAAATKKAELGINQYMVPTNPSSAPVLDPSSFRNNRLTIKQNWKYTWGAASKRGKSGVAGYAVAVWQNGTKMTGLGYSGNTIILNKNNTNNFVAIPSTNCHVTFNPVTLGFKPGDTVALSVWSYSNYGTGTRIGYSSAVTSENTTVQNAGIVRVYVNTGTAASPKYEWKEGQVHVYVNTGTASTPKYEWKEAAVVYTRVGSSWEESS